MSQPEEPSGNGLTVSGWRLTSFAIISMSSLSTMSSPLMVVNRRMMLGS